jgi:hypothetical protein
MEQDPQQQAPDWLAAVLEEVGMVERVWRKCCSSLTPSLPPTLTPSIHTRQREVQSRAMGALQNLLLALPPRPASALPPLAMWTGLLGMVGSGGVALADDVTGLLVVLVGRMEEEEMQCVGADQLELLLAAGRESLCSDQGQVTADLLHLVATVGRRCLLLPLPLRAPLLQVVGRALRDCVSSGQPEWVVARALDSLYDVFGADECPAQLFSDLQIMPVLKAVAAQFTDGVRGRRRELGAHYVEVACARDNLQPFIDYMTSRTSTVSQDTVSPQPL